MAKVSARGAHKVAGVRVDHPSDGKWLSRTRYVLRSDNKLLESYQVACHYDGQPDYYGSANYRILGTVKTPETFDLVAWAQRKHPLATIVPDKDGWK